MKKLQGLQLLLLSGTGLAVSPQTVSLTCVPEQGSRWHRTFEVTSELEFGELSVLMGGQPVPSQFLPRIDMDYEDVRQLEVTDVLQAVHEARPASLHRTYDGASRRVDQAMTTHMGDDAEPVMSLGEGRSPLEGRTVAFDWSEDGEERSAYWVDEDGDGELLERLDADLDLLAWLPEDDVEIGDAWEVPGQRFANLLRPGGDLSIELEGDNIEELERGSDGTDAFTGELTLRLTEIQLDGSERLARVSIEGEVSSERSRAGDLKHVPVASGTTKVEDNAEYSITGELVWDLQSGILRSLDLQAEVALTTHDVKDPGQEGPSFESTATLDGTITIAVSVEPAE